MDQEGTVDEGDIVLVHRLAADDFVSSCWTDDEDKRQSASKNIVSRIKDIVASPQDSTTQQHLDFTLQSILRHALYCPFEDVRTEFTSLLQFLKEQNVTIPQPLFDSPSWFIPASKVIKFNDPDKEHAQRVMEASFTAKGRVSNLFRIMCYFPTFAERYEDLYRFVLYGSGPLPMFWRNYIAIMGASRSNCQYLIVQQEVAFYSNGGDPTWLRGLAYAPVKLQKLATLNALLAHQPWLINKSHLETLMSAGNNEDHWSMAELLQAVLILISFHCLAGLAWGVAVVPEIDRDGGVIKRADESPLFSPGSPAEVAVNDGSVAQPDAQQNTSELVERLRSIKLAKMEDEDSDSSLRVQNTSFDDVLRQRQQHFEEIEHEQISLNAEAKLRRVVNYSKYWGGVDLKHVDFNVKSTEYKVFRLQDYSWEDHGFSLINRYYPGVGELLDSLFTETLTMTDYTLFESEDVDTAPFRQAIWYYVLRLKGMSHDDYAYQQVNSVLNVQLKTYVKKVACVPELVTRQDYERLGVKLFDSEKVHINLLVMEARRQAEVLYVLNALLKLKGE